MLMTRRKLSPREAVERWLDHLQLDRSEQTLSAYWYRLKLFVEWCDDQDIETVGELDGWLLDSYEAHRKGKTSNTNTIKNELTTLKKWIEYCERIEVVDEGLAAKIEPPAVPKDEQSSNVKLATEDAEALLEYYRNDPGMYGSRQHALLEVIWHTGARVGGLVALDVEDLRTTADGDRYLIFRHRPESGTPLKKGPDGERPVLILDVVYDAIQTYIDSVREDVTDDHGRRPLITSQRGRPKPGTVRQWTYQATLPCLHSPCPHGKKRSTCEWTNYNHSSKCPSSRSPHAIRTGAITMMRNSGWSEEQTAARVNASIATIREHYDKEDPLEEELQRRGDDLDSLHISNRDDTNE